MSAMQVLFRYIILYANQYIIWIILETYFEFLKFPLNQNPSVCNIPFLPVLTALIEMKPEKISYLHIIKAHSSMFKGYNKFSFSKLINANQSTYKLTHVLIPEFYNFPHRFANLHINLQIWGMFCIADGPANTFAQTPCSIFPCEIVTCMKKLESIYVNSVQFEMQHPVIWN